MIVFIYHTLLQFPYSNDFYTFYTSHELSELFRRKIFVQITTTNNAEYTLCSEKNTHSCFLLYLRGKWLDFHKIFRECLEGSKYSINEKVKYSLLLVTSCWRHISMFVNFGFYRWKQTYDDKTVIKHMNWSLCWMSQKIC